MARSQTSSTLLAMGVALLNLAMAASPALANPAETAWDALLRENPNLDDATLGPLERAVLEVLTPEQHAAFVDGADPTRLVLASGETLADFLERFVTKGAVAEGLVYFPLPRCTVLETWSATLGKMADDERRDFVARGETTDLSDQGGSATGCDVPMAAEALMVNFRVSDFDSSTGQLRVNARDQSAGYPLIHYTADTGLIYTNSTALDLCLAAACTSDFRVWTKNAGAHVRMDVLGYFAPLGTGGLNTSGTTTTADLTITGLDCTGNSGGGALTTDANGNVQCSDDDAGDDLGDHTATQNLDLAGFKLVSSGGSDGLSIATDGTVTFDGSIVADGLNLDMGALQQQPGDPTLAGSLGLGGNPRSVSVSGRYAYVVSSGSSDLKIIDVSDPSNPSLAGSIVTGSPRSVFVSGRYAYVVGTGSGDLKIIDVADPSAPSLVGSVGVGGSPLSVFVSGRYAYVTDLSSDDLRIIDVSDPSAPSLAGSLPVGSSPNAVFVSGLYAYVVDSQSDDLKVIDVADPSAPSLTGSLALGGVPLSVFVSGRYAYVTDTITDDLRVIDISDPSAPSLAGSLTLGGSPSSVFVSGRYAYVVDFGSDDLKAIDVSDPSAPSLAGSLAIGGLPEAVAVSGRYAYVVDFDSADLKVIDITGAELGSAIVHSLEAGSLQVRESLTAQGQLSVAGGVNVGGGGIFSDGDVGIAGDLTVVGDVDLETITASSGAINFDDEDLTTAGTTTTADLTVTGLDCSGNANGGALTTGAGGAVMCSDDDTGFQNLFATVAGDAGSTTADVQADTLNVRGSGTVSTAVAGDTLTVTGAGDDLGDHTATQNLDLSSFKLVGNGGSDGLQVAADGTVTLDQPLAAIELNDLSQTPGEPVLVGNLGFSENPDSVFVSGRYAYVLTTGDVLGVFHTTLRVIDISDPSTPDEVGSLILPGLERFAESVFVSGRYAYVTTSSTGALHVVDVSDPTSPVQVGAETSLVLAESVFVSGRYAYVTESLFNTLNVLDVSDPSAPSIAGTLGLGNDPLSVFVSGRYAYVPVAGVFNVIDVSDPDTPSVAGSLGIGGSPTSVFVSGRHAYLVDSDSDDLKVIDVSDPSTPALAGSLGIGGSPTSIFVSGRYAYVTDTGSNDLKVIDVSDPSTPVLVDSLGTGDVDSVFVSGRHAYLARFNSLRVIDVSGAELGSAIVHSLEAGSLQVRESLTAQGQLAVTGGVNVGAGGIFSDGDVGVDGNVKIGGDLTLTGSCSGCASDLGLKRNIQPLGDALERIGSLRGVTFDWRDGGREAADYPGPQIGVVAQEVEAVFPELVGTDSRGFKYVRYQKLVAPLIEAVKQLRAENEELKTLLCLDHPDAEICQRK